RLLLLVEVALSLERRRHLVGAAERAVLLRVAPGHEVADRVGAAAHRERVTLEVARLADERRERGGEHLERPDVLPPELAQPRSRGVRAREAAKRYEARVPLRREAPLRLQLPARCAGVTVFREDLDDAVRRFRAVQRGRGRALQHLDACDRFRVDVVQAGCRADAALTTLRVDTYAVDIDDRLVRLRQRRAAADQDVRTLTRHAAGLLHDHARLAA